MSQKPDDIIQISEAELLAMTRDLDEIHQDTSRPAMAEALAYMNESIHEEAAAAEGLKDRRLGRRTFLIGAGAVAGGIALATVPGTAAFAATKTGSYSTAESASALATDLKVTALATSLENLAVAAYGDAIKAVVAGTYGKSIPAAVPVFAETAMAQHAEHAAAWNSVLVGAGKPKVKGLPTFAGSIVKTFEGIKTLTGVLELALTLENVAAQTYQVGSTVVTSKPGIALAASIQPVEMQHAAILYFVLGKYPGIQTSGGTILAFNPTSSAATLSDYTGPL